MSPEVTEPQQARYDTESKIWPWQFELSFLWFYLQWK